MRLWGCDYVAGAKSSKGSKGSKGFSSEASSKLQGFARPLNYRVC